MAEIDRAHTGLRYREGIVMSSPADIAQGILRNSSYQPIRHLKCSACNGVLTVAGRLPSFYLKQVAIRAVQNLEGVSRVEDRIEVSV